MSFELRMFILHGCQTILFTLIIRANFYSSHYATVMTENWKDTLHYDRKISDFVSTGIHLFSFKESFVKRATAAAVSLDNH